MLQISDSDGGYTPLQRPEQSLVQNDVPSVSSTIMKMDETSEPDDSLPEQSSDSDSEREIGFKPKSKKPKLRWVRDYYHMGCQR